MSDHFHSNPVLQSQFPVSAVPVTATPSRHAAPVVARRRQRGMGLFGLLFWLVLVGALVLIGLKVFPTVNEYLTIKRAVNKIAASNPASVGEARSAFESIKAVEYSIVSLSGKDLLVTKNGDDVVIGFEYAVEIELIPPVFLLMKYQGQSQ